MKFVEQCFILYWNEHDREKRGDLFIVYKGKKIGIEVKSLKTLTIKEYGKLGKPTVFDELKMKIEVP